MSLALQHRVSALEAQVRALSLKLDSLSVVQPAIQAAPKKNPNGPRSMCPKCGLKPNYYLHTKNCKG